MKKVIISAIAVAALASQTTHAAPKTEVGYVFGNYTHANLKSNAEGYDKSQSKNTLGFGAGYRYNENFALELGYKGLGKGHDNNHVEDLVNEDIDDTNIDYKSQSLTVRAIGILPLNDQLSIEGFVGAAMVHTKAEEQYTSISSYTGHHQAGEYSISKTKTSLAPSIGVGASYALNDEFTVFTRYEYTALPKIDDLKLKSHTIDLGLRYHF